MHAICDVRVCVCLPASVFVCGMNPTCMRVRDRGQDSF